MTVAIACLRRLELPNMWQSQQWQTSKPQGEQPATASRGASLLMPMQAAAAALIGSPAHAIMCSGPVVAVNMAINGGVEADFGHGVQRVCNLNVNMVRETGTATYGQATITPE